MPAETPQPTDRHRHLAADLVDTVAGAPYAADLEQRVAQLLAAEDAGRVPIAAAGAAYQRGRGDVIRAVRAEIARPAPVESDVAFGLRLLRLLDDLAGPARTADRLDAFRAWLDTDDGRDLVDDVHPVRQALDAFEAADRD